MAAKHDGKKARANHWVMQQNLAKQKGGRPGYQFMEKKPPKASANGKKPVAPSPSTAPEGEGTSTRAPSTTDEVTSAREPSDTSTDD